MSIFLGWEMSTVERVEIPLKHLAITGQTQEAGKTTALEALVARSGLKAVTFITKRGEGAFTSAHRVAPYFRDQGDWQFVAAILEASRQEKLKFERSWIIRASRGAKTLADVQQNIKTAMKTAKGLSADVYLTLDAYLDVVVPTIGAIEWAPTLKLKGPLNALEGCVNAIDLTTMPDEMQQLVIKSTLEWVLHFEKDTIVVVPEAWKFIPQGRNTPVKLAAAAYIRQGAALHNYLWLDSQDLGGIEKEILRSVAVWLIGVQREANEIKRTLDNIPAGTSKPKSADIAWLGLGQFFACWGTRVVRTYVQPTWCDDTTASRYAAGSMPTPPHKPMEVTPVYDEEKAKFLHQVETLEADNKSKDRRLAQLVERVQQLEDQLKQRSDSPTPAAPRRASGSGEGSGSSDRRDRPSPVRVEVDEDRNALYDFFKARLVEDAPALIRVLAEKPSVEVTVTRPVLDFDPSSLKGRIIRLIAGGWFNGDRKTPSMIRGELKRHGPDANTANIGRSMDDFVNIGLFTDEGSGYQIVAGVQARVIDK